MSSHGCYCARCCSRRSPYVPVHLVPLRKSDRHCCSFLRWNGPRRHQRSRCRGRHLTPCVVGAWREETPPKKPGKGLWWRDVEQQSYGCSKDGCNTTTGKATVFPLLVCGEWTMCVILFQGKWPKIIEACLREHVCPVCDHSALRLVPQSLAATAGGSPTHYWTAMYPSSAPCIHIPSPPVSCQQSLWSPIPALQGRYFEHMEKVVEWWHWEDLRPLLLRNPFR